MKVGIIGWRGMVGSVLMERMRAENDFKHVEPVFFSTSQTGSKAPDVGLGDSFLQDAFDIDSLKKMDAIITAQGGDYTSEVYSKLRKTGWNGYWIDAASTLRMEKDSIIILDPVNLGVIKHGLSKGIKTFVGGNCTVSLMLMAIGVLFQNNLVEWISSMTYQAASGAGAKNMTELISQMSYLGTNTEEIRKNPSMAILDLDRKVQALINNSNYPSSNFGAPLAGSLIPWIDKQVDDGQTKEEWKGFAETNKILGNSTPIPIDGLCVRIGAMRSHSQGFTIKMTQNVGVDEITDMIKQSNQWVKVVDNNKADTLKYLTPAAISGTLTVPVGRIHKMRMGPEYLTAFSVGDQLLWGAAEPLRRMLRILIDCVG